MESLTKQVEKTLELEITKKSKEKDFRDLEQLLEKLDKLGLSNKPNYNLPQVDTIGKRLYNSLNSKI